MVCPANYFGLHLAPDRPAREETSGQRAGTLLHTLVLEPDTFAERYAIGPDVNRNTKEWKAFAAALPADVTALKPDEYDEGLKQAESLRRHADIADLLSSGEAETSIFWTDPITGLPCRCRPDWLHETSEGWIVLDLKTGQPDPWDFARQCARLTYGLQQAMYSEGVEEATGKPVIAFVFGVVSTAAPFLSSCVMLDDESIASCRKQYRKLLNKYAECKSKNQWPGYQGVQLVRLPAYALDGD
jgi:exodeoxyribonuclease VIII